MSASRTTEQFIELFKHKKSTSAVAEQILGDLIGYRKTSLHRADDQDTLINALIAVIRIALEAAP